MSKNDQRCTTRALKCVCHRVSWWYIDIFQDIKRTRTTCKDNVAMFKITTIVTQTRKVWVPQVRRWISRICNKNSRSTHEFNKTQSNWGLITINKREGSTSFSRICQLQSQIHKELFEESHIFDQFDDKRQILKLGTQRTRGVQAIARRLLIAISITNV